MNTYTLFNFEQVDMSLMASGNGSEMKLKYFNMDDNIYSLNNLTLTSSSISYNIPDSGIHLDLHFSDNEFIGQVTKQVSNNSSPIIIRVFHKFTTRFQLFISDEIYSQQNLEHSLFSEWKKLYISYSKGENDKFSVHYQLLDNTDPALAPLDGTISSREGTTLLYENITALDGQINKFVLTFNFLKDRLSGFYEKRRDASETKYCMKGIALEDHEIDQDKNGKGFVKYGDVIKIAHTNTNHRLHSHAINYNTGSHQQEITCFSGSDDNDYWIVKCSHEQEGHNEPSIKDGSKISNNAVIRLTHKSTHKNLHSHQGVNAPNVTPFQQEVTGFGENGLGDSNDNWRVEMSNGQHFFQRAALFRLIHCNTNVALSSSHLFQTNVSKQQVVFGNTNRDDGDYWYVHP
ncbi:hypothetical protein FDP41_002912 [Naegleria fowleri]|uniref:MIR domain-containing protein n=1 Tax=Naegleria fowleri TaxID=5763 RepID=A0A6A5BMY3_NAEFO|nr:uncharacterized protein FDP41_002912 [Naegleria fowleri]KAF0978397.1 hypothetical protein FDP41_002912 [Naegleria fowleri]